MRRGVLPPDAGARFHMNARPRFEREPAMQAQDPRTPWMDAADELGHVLKAQKGDRKSFLALLRHYHRPVYRLAFALTRDVHAAVTVTHAAVLKARDGVRYLSEGRGFFAWIAGIVRNLARSRRGADAVEGAPVSAPGLAPEEAALAERLLVTMDGLDPDVQAAVALRSVERLPDARVETVLGQAPGSARSLLAAASARLAAQIQPGEPQPPGHLTPGQLAAHLDGALEGGAFDLVRHHLEWCELCRARCVHMASASEVLAALLTHDPDEGFFDALETLLEDPLEGKDAGAIPSPLERRIIEESARHETERWAAVRDAIPPSVIAPAQKAARVSVARPADAAGAEPASPWEARRRRRAGRRAQPLETIDDSHVRPLPDLASSESSPAAGPSPQPMPGATTRPPAGATHSAPPARNAPAASRPSQSPAIEPPPISSGVSRFIGAAIVALAILLVLSYLNLMSPRPRAGELSVSSATPSAAAGKAQAPLVKEAPRRSTAPPSREPGAKSPTEAQRPPSTTALAAREPRTAAQLRPAAAKPATGPSASQPATDSKPATRPTAAALKPAGATPSEPHSSPAAGERGILCGVVRDEGGTPIVGAQVLLADLQVGTLTDGRGRFCISVPLGSRTVSVIALGFTTQRRAVTVGRHTAELVVALRSAAVESSPESSGP
jgi:DNA-directed RNA polymerase specialized sigma24 family protein